MSYLYTYELNKRLEELEEIEEHYNNQNDLLVEYQDDLREMIDVDGEEYQELQNEIDDLISDIEHHEYHDISDELEELQSLKNELGSVWDDGETLIPEDDFVDYCKDLCEELGYISRDFPTFIEIDWDSTAENLKSDYQCVTFEGNDYYVRSY